MCGYVSVWSLLNHVDPHALIEPVQAKNVSQIIHVHHKDSIPLLSELNKLLASQIEHCIKFWSAWISQPFLVKGFNGEKVCFLGA